MSSSNLSYIWKFIDNNIGATVAANSGSSYDAFNLNFSNYLNGLWDPAWNVFTIKTIASIDAILYGYAFRNHWMWYNGYIVQGTILDFVIWKDYNCHTWMVVGD